MNFLNDFFGEKLFIVQPKFLKNYFELNHNEEVIGNLEIKGFFKNKAHLKIFEKNFLFIQRSFWRSIIEVIEENKELPIAIYRSKAFRNFGFIDLPFGESLKVSYNFFNSGYDLRNSLDQILMIYSLKFPFKNRTEISIEKKSQMFEKYPWIIFLPFFISRVRNKNSKVI